MSYRNSVASIVIAWVGGIIVFIIALVWSILALVTPVLPAKVISVMPIHGSNFDSNSPITSYQVQVIDANGNLKSLYGGYGDVKPGDILRKGGDY